MRRTIWKFPVDDLRQPNIVSIPGRREIVSVAHDPNGVRCFWALVAPDEPKFRRAFVWIGTGHELEPEMAYRGSLNESPFVWHLFKLSLEYPAAP